MHVYILFAHPSRQSFNRAVLASFCAGLTDAHHTYEVGDLYEMGFQEREVGLDPEPPVPPDVQVEQKKIARADALAFIYPVWWSDCPAVLKGWFDRVLTYGYAYWYDDAESRHTEIAVKKAVVLCSAGHTEAHLEETGIAESMRHIMLNDRLLGVGVQAATMEILGGMMPGDDTWRARNLQRAYAQGRDL
ncbi:MAG: NAD(P)H-dependent oxidoreductase [Planctomycetota bacterium]|jgi:NAD(P)H dehydrogenase (quinone)